MCQASRVFCRSFLVAAFLRALAGIAAVADEEPGPAKDGPPPINSPQGLQAAVDPTTLNGKVMCGYQAWFRCPGDGADLGWIHWSRDSRLLTPQTLTFEMWPDLTEFSPAERFAAPGFTLADGSPASLFSSAVPRTTLRHFEWLRDYGIDGVWLQHFVVDLPGGPNAARFRTRREVVDHVADAAATTGRCWAVTYDIADMPGDRVFDVLTADWKRMVDEHRFDHPRYLRQDGKPVVQIFGFYFRNPHNPMTAELGQRLIEFFHTPGPYQAYLVGGGDWDWRRNRERGWPEMYAALDAYVPWNIGNFTVVNGEKRASTEPWSEDRAVCRQHGVRWIPSVYPGFGWDNLQQKPAGTSQIGRRGGRFLWEQFYELARQEGNSAFVAMFDEVDEGTAIFKVTSSPPAEAHFVGYEGLPSDWYLRLVGEGARMLRHERQLSAEIPIKP